VAASTVKARLISTRDAAQYLSVSPATVRRLHYAGELPAIRCLKSLRFDVHDLDAWITTNKETLGD
jgi:excisionase family DNA binding protein